MSSFVPFFEDIKNNHNPCNTNLYDSSRFLRPPLYNKKHFCQINKNRFIENYKIKIQEWNIIFKNLKSKIEVSIGHINTIKNNSNKKKEKQQTQSTDDDDNKPKKKDGKTSVSQADTPPAAARRVRWRRAGPWDR